MLVARHQIVIFAQTSSWKPKDILGKNVSHHHTQPIYPQHAQREAERHGPVNDQQQQLKIKTEGQDMTTAAVTLPRRTGRHTAGPTPTEESWAPAAYPREDADPFLQPRISARFPAPAASHPEAANQKGSSEDSAWWQASRRSSSVEAAQAQPQAQQQAQQQQQQSQQQQQQAQQAQTQPPSFAPGRGTVWTDGPVGLEYNSSAIRGGSLAAIASGNMAKASYMSQPPPFDPEDRLEIFTKRVGGFGAEQTAPGAGGGGAGGGGGETGWRGGQSTPTSVAPAAGGVGLEVWPSSNYGGITDSAASAGMPWARPGGGGGGGGGAHHDLRQVRALRESDVGVH